MRVGVDSSKFPGAPDHSAAWVLQRARELGLDGVYFRSVLELSPGLDRAELRDVAELAAELGMYLEVGVAKLNPFALAEMPEARELGGGDTVRGIERMIRACADAGIHELWSATGNYKFDLPGYLGCDRFRTDVAWADQLAATLRVMRRLAPVLRDCRSHINLETHEEITSFELVRLVEAAGPDAFGITFDVANVICRAEDPVAAARRVGPYVRSSHIRDAQLRVADRWLARIITPCGTGIIDWSALLDVLGRHAPALHLSIEGVVRAGIEMPLAIDDEQWLAAHPDLVASELAGLVAHATSNGHGSPWGPPRRRLDDELRLKFITESARYLRALLKEKAL